MEEDKKYRISDEQMDADIERYNQAKADGTLDEKYPVVAKIEKLQEQPQSSKASHLAPYQFKKGQSGNPEGRKPGKSLKERAKAMLNAMTPEEEQEFLEGIDKRTIWEMAEGKAKQDMDVKHDATVRVISIDE